MAVPALSTPAQRTASPRSVARVCLNGDLAGAALPPDVALGTPTSRGGPGWDLAAQILAVVLPADRRAGISLRGAFPG